MQKNMNTQTTRIQQYGNTQRQQYKNAEIRQDINA